VKGDEEASLGKGQGHPTPMIKSSCNLDFDFTGALAGRGWPCLLLLIVDELHGEIRPIYLTPPYP